MAARVGTHRAVQGRVSRASREDALQKGSVLGSIAFAGGLILAVGSMLIMKEK